MAMQGQDKKILGPIVKVIWPLGNGHAGPEASHAMLVVALIIERERIPNVNFQHSIYSSV